MRTKEGAMILRDNKRHGRPAIGICGIVNPGTNQYRSVHKIIRHRFGKAYACENKFCKKNSNRFDWSLISGREYSLDIKDYIMLCRSCHTTQDAKRNGQKPHSKLTPHNVKYILSNAGRKTHKEMAAMFGVSRQAIGFIVNGTNWQSRPKIKK